MPMIVAHAAIVCSSHELRDKARRLASQIEAPQALQALAEQAMFCSPPESRASKPKIAWLFPGQGSQYPGMLKSLVEGDPFAARKMREANQVLAEMNQPSFEELAWQPESQLGEDVWFTQAAMLLADWIMCSTLTNRGFAPSLISGHSFGEFAALLAAGCWDLQNALAATRHRCQSIAKYVSPGCALLSIQANRTTTQRLLDESAVPLSISHLNAPQQTVVGGRQAAVARFAQILEEEGIPSRLLPVPTAFHTPSLQAAVEPFHDALRSVALDPPRIPVLSSITNAYAADPWHIRQALADQLVHPADFIGLVKRLVSDGVTLAVEVGPQQVLSKLVRQNTDRLTVIATDHPKRGCAGQLLCAQAVMELQQPVTEASKLPTTRGTDGWDRREQRTQHATPVHFDATSGRRQRVRSTAGQVASKQVTRRPKVQPAAHFDATSSRRQSRRAAAQSQSVSAGPRLPDSQPNSHEAPETTLAAEHTSSQQPAAYLHRTEQEVAAASGVAAASEVAVGSGAIEQFLIDFVVEQTGYPAEIIELDWDIEADLGIDSIKKAQLFGELREFFELEVHQGLSLDRFITLRDIVDLLERTPGKGSWLVETGDHVDATVGTRDQQASNSGGCVASDGDHAGRDSVMIDTAAMANAGIDTRWDR